MKKSGTSVYFCMHKLLSSPIGLQYRIVNGNHKNLRCYILLPLMWSLNDMNNYEGADLNKYKNPQWYNPNL